MFKNVYTDADVSRYHALASTIEVVARHLLQELFTHLSISAANIELVVAVGSINNRKWGYYFADTPKKRVFWADPLPLSTVLSGSPLYVSSNEHLGKSDLTLNHWRYAYSRALIMKTGLELESQDWYAYSLDL